METEPGDITAASTANTDSAAPRESIRQRKKKRAKRAAGTWYGKKPRKLGWKDAREEFVLGKCEHCRAECVEHTIVGTNLYVKYVGAVDHIVPERLLLQLSEKNPHESINLMCLHKVCHGIKIGADRLLCRGDKLGYLQRLRENGWPMDRVEAALAFFGI